MTQHFDRQLRLGYGFSIGILLLVGLVSWLTLRTLLNSNEAVAHSGEVMQKLEALLSTMKDAETGQRGYLLSGERQFLEPYNGAYQQAQRLNAELKDLTADNKTQQANANAISKVLYQRLNILQELVGKKQRGQPITAAELTAGKAAMDALRSVVSNAEKNERILLKARTEKLKRYTDLVPAFILFALVMALGITLYSYQNVTRDVREKERLRRELEQSEEETQALNEELTAANEEITAANEELTAINEELTEARDELFTANNTLEERVSERTKALQESEEETQALNEELTAMNEEMTATNEELHAANDELRAAEERSAKLVAIVESSDDAIIGKDLDGIVTAWNRGAEQIFGYAEAEIVGQPILKLIPEELQHEEPDILSRLRQGEKIDHYETLRRRSNGQLIHVSLTISPIRDREGRVIGLSKIARDITEQKQDEQRKNDFIGMASHELKTPLTTLTALIQVMQQKTKDQPESFIKQALDKANLQTKKMAGLINGFLNVSRLDSGKLEIRKTRFDLVNLLHEQLDEIRLTVSSHHFELASPPELMVSADHDKLGSVISNLLSNAVKYSPKGKIVSVAVARQGDDLQISVRDEGMGVSAQDLQHIFDRYYRAGSEHTKHISGFGVGLYLSAEIITHHGGRIWAESEKGTGSTFFFTLPV